MNLFAIVVATSFITSLTASQHTNGETRRFLLDGLHVDKDELDKIPDVLKEIECTKCKCDHECHARDFDLEESDVCDDFWESISCRDYRPDCSTYPCHNGGSCYDVNGSFRCTCTAQWSGHNCEIEVQPQDQCATLNCLHGTCSVTNGVASCICNQGWKGNQCQTDINECTQQPCQHNGYCLNTVGTYSCSCPNGWEGIQCDIDTNECLRNPCPIANATCTNTDGSYTCSCPSGWEGNNCEIDIDECTRYRFCQNGATCVNTQGHFTCTCQSGWKGTQCQTDVDECLSNPCNHGTCSNNQGSYTCTCSPGWSGVNCEKGGNSTECDHICSLESAVKQVPVTFLSATCSGSSTFAPNEALLQTCCSIGDKSGWKQGQKVMTKCGTNSMNAFTPVAAYINGVIVPDTAGILTGCLHHGETGFMIIRQDCLTNPTLYHLNGTNTGIFESNPQQYYELI